MKVMWKKLGFVSIMLTALVSVAQWLWAYITGLFAVFGTFANLGLGSLPVVGTFLSTVSVGNFLAIFLGLVVLVKWAKLKIN